MANRAWGTYFSVVSVLLLFLSIVAFSDNLFTDIGQPSNGDPKFVVHGLFGLAWYVLLATQANLVRVRNLRLHRKLGIATFIVAIGVTLSTLYLFVVLWKGWANMSGEVRANRLFLPSYALCLWSAWLRRGQPDWHKRLIFTGTFFMLGPVLARAYDPLIASWTEPLFPAFAARMAGMRMDFAGLNADPAFLAFFYGVWIGFFLSLARYDWKTLRRIHPVTVAGPVWFVLAWLISLFT
ncbi:hypothetical protein J5837_07870 [Pseudoxanthomonas helianthi]|uniref:Uncharacterized protein n=1 Tax=Pseudoxanthomonas helianthi TaxID=1453541 RepID=A0A941ATV2_9GAMM|nr:hypothetical protein [Pseudoxanthomonas helianthi]MBP3984345.1 hypothetical protein [Pseudoxanthomonas helianthi]